MYSMKNNLVRVIFLLLTITICFTKAGLANSENFPESPIELTIPLTTGNTDTAFRLLTARMYPDFISEPVIIVNKPGAGGTVGVAEISKAKPDGYKMVTSATSTMFVMPYVREVPYSYDDFTPICRIFDSIGHLCVRSDAPWNTLDEFVEYSRNNPVRVAIGGAWSMEDLVIKQINDAIGVEWILIPFDGGAESIVAILSGATDAVAGYGLQLPLLASGELKALVTFADSRYALTPDVPTLGEFGYEGVSGYSSSCGVYIPKGVPSPILEKLEKVFYDAFHKTDFQEAIVEKLGLYSHWMGSEEYHKHNVEIQKAVKKVIDRYLVDK